MASNEGNMITRDALGKIAYAGKSIHEVVEGLTAAGFIVTPKIEGSNLLLEVTQVIEISLGVDPALQALATKAKKNLIEDGH